MTYPFAGIHLRTERDEDVGDLVSGLDCFHSAPILGWISVFEQESGEGDLSALGSLASLLTEELECEALAFLGIDESAFFYLHFDRGELVAEYGSDPTYFGELNEQEAAALTGNPGLLAPLLIPGATEESVEAVLADEHLGSRERCESLSRLLGIQNGPATFTDFTECDDGNSETIIGIEYFERSGGEPVGLDS